MTDETINHRRMLVEKAPGTDPMRGMAVSAAEVLMELGSAGRTGAACRRSHQARAFAAGARLRAGAEHAQGACRPWTRRRRRVRAMVRSEVR
jgi:hypothetical protein